MKEDIYNKLITNLNKFIKKYYRNELIKGAIYVFGGLLAAFLIAITLEYLGQFNTLIRSVLFYIFIIFSLAIIFKYILIPLASLYRIGKVISHEQAAAIIGKHFNNVKDKLTNVLQLRQQSVEMPEDVLLQAGINQKIEQLNPVPFSTAINLRENSRYLKYLIPILLLGLLLFIFAPGIYTSAPKRIIEHNQYFEPVMPFEFTIKNKNLTVLKNEDFTLELQLSGSEIPKQVYIEYESKRFLMQNTDKFSFSYTFKNLQKSINFHFSANGFISKTYQLKVFPKPILLNFNVQIDYPKYTHKKNKELTNNGNLIVPEGTKIAWLFNTVDSRELILQFNDSSFSVPQKTADQYQFKTKAMRSFKYGLKPINNRVKNMEFVHYDVKVIPDEYPSIELQSRADSVTHKLVYFKGYIKDDYGLTKLTFNYKRKTKEQANQREWKSISIPVNKDMLQQNFYYTWNLDTLHLQPGENLDYYFKVWDNDGVHGPKSTKTATQQFGVPKYELLAEKSDKQAKEIEQNMEEAISKAIRMKGRLDQLNEDLFNKTQMGWQEKENIKDLINLHKDLQKNIDKMQSFNKKKNALDKNYMQLDSNIIKKQEQLEKLMKELQSPEMKKLMEELQKMKDKLNKSQIQKQLEKIQLSNKDINKSMDRTLELFRQLEFQKKLNELSNKLEKQQAMQDSLSKESAKKKADSKEIKKSQDKLNDLFKQAKDDVQALQKLNKKLENKHDASKLEELSKEVEQEQQKASQQLENNKSKKASESQENAANKMQKMNDMASDMLNQMKAGTSPEDLKDLRQLLENIMQLSFDQEDLMTQLKNTSNNDPQYLQINRKQKNLSENAKMIEDSLFALSKRVIQIKSTVNKEIDAINMNLGRAMDYMSDHKTSQALSRQQYVMTSLNNLALMLDDAVQQAMQAMKSGKPGDGSCNKPGGKGSPSPAPSMQSLQQMLEKQIQSMKDAMKQGGNKPGSKPGNKPGSQPGQGMSEKLAKMAAEQSYIRQQMQKMMNQMKGGGGSKGMNGINKMLEENKKDMVNNNITPETINRQRKILTRLLDAEKADRKQGLSKKRKATEAKNQDFSNPNQFFEYNKKKQAEVELLQTMPPNFTNYYKKKVANYFQNIIEQ